MAATDRRRHLSDVASIAVGGAMLAGAWAAARHGEVPAHEETAFRTLNDLPEPLRAVWPVMQLGNVAAIPLVALAAGRVGHDRSLALAVGVSGTAGYLGAKAVKQVVQRARPDALVDGARLRERARGLGFVSGHAAESAAMATVIAARLPRHRWIPRALAAVVALSRVYVGAHLPHDVVGGAGMGMAIGGVVNLASSAQVDSGRARGRGGRR